MYIICLFLFLLWLCFIYLKEISKKILVIYKIFIKFLSNDFKYVMIVIMTIIMIKMLIYLLRNFGRELSSQSSSVNSVGDLILFAKWGSVTNFEISLIVFCTTLYDDWKDSNLFDNCCFIIFNLFSVFEISLI